MADVGIRMYADGAAAFKSAVSGVNAQLKNLNSEMKLAVAELSGVDDAAELTAKKTDILTRSMEAAKQKAELIATQYRKQKERLDELGAAHDEARRKFGDLSDEAAKAEKAFNRQATEVNKLGTQLNYAKQDVVKFEKALADVGDEARDVERDLKDAADGAEGFSDSFLGAFTGGAIIGGLEALASGIADLVADTREYSRIMTSLQVSSENAGYSAEQTEQTFRQLHGVLGDTQTAATATANLQALNLEQEKLTELTDGVIGAWATYGDSIPIDSLAEATLETIRAKESTGAFSDVLNWAGVDVDAFNDKLQAATTESERAEIVLDELARQGLPNAAKKWRETGEEIVAANNAQADLDKNLAYLGDTLAPAMSAATEVIAAIVGKIAEMAAGFKQMIEEGDPLIAVIAGIAGALAAMGIAQVITNMGGLINIVKQLATAFTGLNASLGVIGIVGAAVAALITLWNTNEDFRNAVIEIWENIKTVIGGVVDGIVTFFTETVPGAIDTVKNFFIDLGKRIIESQRESFEFIAKIADGIKTFFTETIPSAINTVKDFFVDLGLQIIESQQKSFEVVSAVVSGIKTFFTETVPEAINTVIGFFKSIPEKVATIGRELIEGLWEGIQIAGTWIKEKIGGFCDGIVQSFKDVFKISSPSKLMRDEVGEDVGKGVALGITDSTAEAVAAAETFADKVFNTISGAGAGVGVSVSANVEESTTGQQVAALITGGASEAAAEIFPIVTAGMFAMEPVLMEYLEELKERIMMLLQSFYGEFRSMGRFLMEGVAEGIEAGRSRVINAIASAIAAAIAQAQSQLDISSPSGVFEEIGGYMMEGVGVGWTKRAGKVVSQIGNSMQNMAAVALSGTRSGTGGNVNSKSYTYGDINLYVDRIDNGNGRDIQTLMEEMEFYRRQQVAGRGVLV